MKRHIQTAKRKKPVLKDYTLHESNYRIFWKGKIKETVKSSMVIYRSRQGSQDKEAAQRIPRASAG